MRFDWRLMAIVFVINAACMGIMWLAQALDKSLPPRGSLIPGTNQKFLYMQDFWLLWGDMIGVPLIVTAFIHFATVGRMTAWHWAVLVVIFFVTIGLFLRLCLAPEHKPDVGFPASGTISWNGIVHLPYFGLGWAMAIIALVEAFRGNLRGVSLWIAVAGGLIYLTFFVIELRSGNFNPLKPVAQEKLTLKN